MTGKYRGELGSYSPGGLGISRLLYPDTRVPGYPGTGTQVLISTWYPDTQVGVDTDLNELKNGTSAKNGGPCTPYPIIHEPELRLPSY